MADGALDEAAAVQHLVAERGRLLGGIAALVGGVLLEDPFDLGTELGDLVRVEHAVEHRVSVRLEVLHRGGNRAGSERQVSGRGPSEHSPILPPMGLGDNVEPAADHGHRFSTAAAHSRCAEDSVSVAGNDRTMGGAS